MGKEDGMRVDSLGYLSRLGYLRLVADSEDNAL
jgi:hypothetical protein